ncbi:MAG TPA: TRAP transporter TatT component family protein [Bacteriovoracaceae bacterium]|nr:TRAP transporter TatT component family protein [Bacteriovoracaceae bacterium]
MTNLILSLFFILNLAVAQEDQSKLKPQEAGIMKTEALRLWEKRDNLDSLQEGLSKFEMAQTDGDLEVLTYLSRGHFILADLHLDNAALRKRHYEKGYEFGVKGLHTNPEFTKLMEKKDSVEQSLDVLTVKEAEILFWSAVSLGKYAHESGLFSKIKHKDQILAMIRKVEKLDPKIHHGGVPRFWASFYALAPSVAGGDMKKSKKYFEEAIQVAPEYLGSKVIYAEVYHTSQDDKKSFKKVLLEVLAAPNGPTDLVPENILWKKKAEKLLANEDDLF